MNNEFSLNAVGKKLAGAIDLFKRGTFRNPMPEMVVAWKLKLGIPNGSYFSTTEIAMQMQGTKHGNAKTI